MREPRIFEASYDLDPDDTLPFVLRFQNSRTGETKDFSFEAIGDPGMGGAKVVSETLIRKDGKLGISVDGLRTFFKRALVGDGADRLDALLDDPLLMIDGSNLYDAYNWIVEEWAGRPTTPSRDSSELPSPNGSPSTVPPSLTAVTSTL